MPLLTLPSKNAVQRILIISYEFDATGAPQGLRWVRLSDELAKLGWDVDVIAPSNASADRLLQSNKDICVSRVRTHRFFAGPYQYVTRQRRISLTQKQAGSASTVALSEGHLNWKGRLDASLRSLSAKCLYPDLRRESLPFLRSSVRKLLSRNAYHVAILSHEPPLSLETRDLFARASIPVVADLGDPVCAPYTPERWRRRAFELEAAVCRDANALIVTTRATLDLLHERHGRLPADTCVISQGYQQYRAPRGLPAPPSGKLHLVYTGRFYRFRNPTAVLSAVNRSDDVMLDIATPQSPDWLPADLLESSAVQVRYGLDHSVCLELQASADVLLVIGNDEPGQTPGKLFEYMGASAPILYVTGAKNDPAAALVATLRRGVVVANDPGQIFTALQRLCGLHRAGKLHEAFDLSEERVHEYSWQALAARYSALLQNVIRSHHPIDPGGGFRS